MDVAVFTCEEYRLTVSTASIIDAWDRFKCRVDSRAMTYCDYKSSRDGELQLYCINERKSGLVPFAPSDGANEWHGKQPVLFETCEYQFAVEFGKLEDSDNERKRPKIRHRLKAVCDSFKFYRSGKHSGILVGTIDFMNSPGNFSFQFEYTDINGIHHDDHLDFYVASPKLDTKNDLPKITKMINEEYENYVFEYLTLTFSSLALTKSERSNHIIWLSIFRDVINNYFANVRYIMSRPNNRPQRVTYHSRPERIHKWSQSEIERYKSLGSDADRFHYRSEVAENSVNTKENRFVKYSLLILGRKFQKIYSEIGALYKDMDDEERETLRQYHDSFQRLKSSAFFRRVGEFEGFRQESTILQQRSGYSQIYKTWLMLKSSLDLIEGKTDIGMKKIWELYEIWCFLVMKRLIAKVLQIDLNDEKRISEDKSEMLNTIVRSGMTHVVTFKPENGDIIKLEYQHTYNRRSKDNMKTTTTEQRPDIVVSVTKPYGFVLTYLFDAKYRVLDDKTNMEIDDGVDIDIADYPLPDAINQMHRYRDAIYYAQREDLRPLGKEVIGGYILFPGRVGGEKIKDRYFFKSIEKVNIGAFPLLPSDSDQDDELVQSPLLEEHLRSILLEGDVIEHIKDSIPQKGLTYSLTFDENDVMVLVGYCQKENKEKVLKEKLYYVRVGIVRGSLRLVPGYEHCKYLLLYNNEGQALYKLSELSGPRLVMKDELIKRGFNVRHDYYLAFDIESAIPVVQYVSKNGKVFRIKEGATRYSKEPYFTKLSQLLNSESEDIDKVVDNGPYDTATT